MARKKKTRADGSFSPSGESKAIIPLGNDEWAYVFDIRGKTHHVRRTSEELVSILRETDEYFGGKASRQLEELGWEDVLERLNDRSENNS